MAEPETESRTWRFAYGAAMALVLAAFLYSLQGTLNPFLLYLLLVMLASPYAGSRSHLLVISGAGLLTAIWLLRSTGSLLAPFFLAVAFAYILRPVVLRMEGPRVPRGLAIGLLGLPMVGLLAAVVLLGIPALSAEVSGFVEGIPGILQRTIDWVDRMRVTLQTRDLPYIDEEALLLRLRSVRPEDVLAFVQARQAAIAQQVWGAILGAGRGLGVALTILSYLFLTPILTFYLLRDYETILRRLGALVPRARQARVFAFAREYDSLLSSYLRGQIIAAAIVGVLTWLGFWVLGFPYALLLGAVAGVFNLVPYLGLVVTLVPALFIALFSGDILLSLGKVALVFGVVQVLDGSVVGPRIVGESVGLHPVWVILALTVFGFFFGFVGLLLAIPLAVLLKLVLKLALDHYRRSPLFQQPDA